MVVENWPVGALEVMPCWNEGMGHRELIPPPPPEPFWHLPDVSLALAQGTSEVNCCVVEVVSVVPPTPVTFGLEAGSSTFSVVPPLSNAPQSPAAANTAIPSATILVNTVFSAFAAAWPWLASSRPQEVLTWLTR